MSGFDGEQIFYSNQNLGAGVGLTLAEQRAYTHEEISTKFKQFIREWTYKNSYIYREQLLANYTHNTYYLKVDIDDLNNFDMKLGSLISEKPLEFHQDLEQATKETLISLIMKQDIEMPNFQVQIISNEIPKALRLLKSDLLGKLITVRGIITSANKVQLKSKKLKIECKNCGHKKDIVVAPGIPSFGIPRFCDRTTEQGANREQCPRDPFIIVAEETEMVDQQVLKLQENPEMIPTGEIPRTFQIFVDRYLTGKLIPGSRVKLTGIYTVVESRAVDGSAATLRLPYIIVLGYQMDSLVLKKLDSQFTLEEEAKFLEFARSGTAYEKISKSIASAIYGSEDIKKAVACLLFGGSRKFLPDNTKLRGDINILLIGDPSTAKSQFLKFVERVAPISVYTSGKGSSAAGLTASIIRDPSTGEFQLEGGSLVLADGGVVCIDEFDKMRAPDRVALHEAMEQQTISIAKAGITTILNSRTSVLAAANPIFGKYDDLKQISDQIDLQTTILSRFDCIFIVKDNRNERSDTRIADHIINLHMGGTMEVEETEIDLTFLKKYVTYCRSRCSPRLNEEAAKNLENLYVEDRKKVQAERHTKKSHIPITVRQLEAIIRLSEALAKMSLATSVTVEHVREAHRLFQVSTLSAISSGLDSGAEMPQEIANLVMKVEEAIRRRVAIGNKINHSKLIEEMTARYMNQRAVEWAIINMIKTDEFQHIEGRRVLMRKK